MAQDTPDAAVVSFEYRDGQFSGDFIAWVASYGARTPVAAKPGGTLASYASDLCNSTSPDNIELFRRSLAEQNIAVADDGTVATSEGTLLLPPCLPEPTSQPIARVVQPGERLWDYYDTATSGFGDPSGTIVQVSPDEMLAGSENPPLANPFEDALASVDISKYDQLKAFAESYLGSKAYGAGQDGGAIALDAFLAANSLLEAGADPVDTKAAMLESINKVVTSVDRPGVEEAFSNALKRWSGSSAITSGSWQQILNPKARPATLCKQDSCASFIEEVQWLDPQPETRKPTDLQPGDIVVTPAAATQSVQIPIDGALLPKGGASTVAFISDTLPEIVDAPAAGAPPPEVTLLDAQPMEDVRDTTCTDARYPTWGNASFAEAFIEAAIRTRLLSYRHGKQKNEATITIIDSGFVEAADEGAFRGDAFREVGSGLHAEAASPQLGDKRGHGTAVAGLALGGPDLWGLSMALGLDVKIMPRKIYDDRQLGNEIRPVVNFGRMDSAIEGDGDIFNISFTSTNEGAMMRFVTHLGEGGKLFVIAAGNNNMNFDSRGVDIADTSLFPQLYGGDDQLGSNIITVAAFDGTKRAWFSNFSTEHVSIAAPGCSIRSWSPTPDNSKYEVKAFTGTSYSAPIVAYVAAIVKALAPDKYVSAQWVRARILASADLTTKIDGVEDGRLLNPIKAVALYEDVVEVERNGERSLLFGDLQWLEDLNEFCVDEGLPAGGRLLKFAADPDGAEPDDFLIYYMGADRTLHTKTCKRRDATLPMTLSSTGATQLLNLTDVRDIVFRME